MATAQGAVVIACRLDSDDEAKRLSAARALYSYAATRPPEEQQAQAASPIPLWFLQGLQEAGLIRYEIVEESGRTFVEYALLDVLKSIESTFLQKRDRNAELTEQACLSCLSPRASLLAGG